MCNQPSQGEQLWCINLHLLTQISDACGTARLTVSITCCRDDWQEVSDTQLIVTVMARIVAWILAWICGTKSRNVNSLIVSLLLVPFRSSWRRHTTLLRGLGEQRCPLWLLGCFLLLLVFSSRTEDVWTSERASQHYGTNCGLNYGMNWKDTYFRFGLDLGLGLVLGTSGLLPGRSSSSSEQASTATFGFLKTIPEIKTRHKLWQELWHELWHDLLGWLAFRLLGLS